MDRQSHIPPPAPCQVRIPTEGLDNATHMVANSHLEEIGQALATAGNIGFVVDSVIIIISPVAISVRQHRQDES